MTHKPTWKDVGRVWDTSSCEGCDFKYSTRCADGSTEEECGLIEGFYDTPEFCPEVQDLIDEDDPENLHLKTMEAIQHVLTPLLNTRGFTP